MFIVTFGLVALVSRVRSKSELSSVTVLLWPILIALVPSVPRTESDSEPGVYTAPVTAPLTVVTPAFHGGRLVALFACTAHVADIGGNGPDPTSRDVLAEGLFIPIMPLCSEGKVSPWLMNLMRSNNREPDRLEGDVYALLASNEAGASRLLRMLDEYKIADLDALSEHILSASDQSMREAIAKLPKGTWSHAMRIDGFDEPLDLTVKAMNRVMDEMEKILAAKSR